MGRVGRRKSRGKSRIRGDRTKSRILDAAERQFAKHGYDGVSLRALAAAADAQLALIHYHFGSKLDLYRAVWARWLTPFDLSKPSPVRPELPAGVPLEANVRTFVDRFFEPLIRLMQTPRGRHLLTILGREMSDPKATARGVLKLYVDPRLKLLVGDIQRLMPSLTAGEVSLGYNMMAGIATSVLVNHARIMRTSRGVSTVDDLLKSLPAVITFVVGGWLGIHQMGVGKHR